MSREARDEKQIGGKTGPKEILVSMRKDQQYKETKMRLLHKFKGLELVSDSFDRLVGKSPEESKWFKGYHVFSSRTEVVERFMKGKPLSCFCLENNKAEVHVAFTEDEKRSSTISYLTFTYDTARSTVETGVHFCLFNMQTEGCYSHKPAAVLNIKKGDLEPKIVHCALMLPHLDPSVGDSSREDLFDHYTLIYSDWEVLRCDGDVKKGRVTIDEQLFRSNL